MRTVTIEQFMEFDPCYSKDKIKKIAGDKAEWTALDVLRLDVVPASDRLWAVLREDFVDAPIMHEFACRCAEKALSRVEKPDPRSVEAIAVKRAWLRGEATDDELSAAWSAARSAAWDAARSAARSAAWDEQVTMLIEMLED